MKSKFLVQVSHLLTLAILISGLPIRPVIGSGSSSCATIGSANANSSLCEGSGQYAPISVTSGMTNAQAAAALNKACPGCWSYTSDNPDSPFFSNPLSLTLTPNDITNFQTSSTTDYIDVSANLVGQTDSNGSQTVTSAYYDYLNIFAAYSAYLQLFNSLSNILLNYITIGAGNQSLTPAPPTIAVNDTLPFTVTASGFGEISSYYYQSGDFRKAFSTAEQAEQFLRAYIQYIYNLQEPPGLAQQNVARLFSYIILYAALSPMQYFQGQAGATFTPTNYDGIALAFNSNPTPSNSTSASLPAYNGSTTVQALINGTLPALGTTCSICTAADNTTCMVINENANNNQCMTSSGATCTLSNSSSTCAVSSGSSCTTASGAVCSICTIEGGAGCAFSGGLQFTEAFTNSNAPAILSTLVNASLGNMSLSLPAATGGDLSLYNLFLNVDWSEFNAIFSNSGCNNGNTENPNTCTTALNFACSGTCPCGGNSTTTPPTPPFSCNSACGVGGNGLCSPIIGFAGVIQQIVQGNLYYSCNVDPDGSGSDASIYYANPAAVQSASINLLDQVNADYTANAKSLAAKAGKTPAPSDLIMPSSQLAIVTNFIDNQLGGQSNTTYEYGSGKFYFLFPDSIIPEDSNNKPLTTIPVVGPGNALNTVPNLTGTGQGTNWYSVCQGGTSPSTSESLISTMKTVLQEIQNITGPATCTGEPVSVNGSLSCKTGKEGQTLQDAQYNLLSVLVNMAQNPPISTTAALATAVAPLVQLTSTSPITSAFEATTMGQLYPGPDSGYPLSLGGNSISVDPSVLATSGKNPQVFDEIFGLNIQNMSLIPDLGDIRAQYTNCWSNFQTCANWVAGHPSEPQQSPLWGPNKTSDALAWMGVLLSGFMIFGQGVPAIWFKLKTWSDARTAAKMNGSWGEQYIIAYQQELAAEAARQATVNVRQGPSGPEASVSPQARFTRPTPPTVTQAGNGQTPQQVISTRKASGGSGASTGSGGIAAKGEIYELTSIQYINAAREVAETGSILESLIASKDVTQLTAYANALATKIASEKAAGDPQGELDADEAAARDFNTRISGIDDVPTIDVQHLVSFKRGGFPPSFSLPSKRDLKPLRLYLPKLN